MLLVGDFKCIPNNPKIVNRMVIYNLSSMSEKWERVNLLPPLDINFQDDSLFDQMYGNAIFNNDDNFLQLMKIIINLYDGYNVYIAVTRDEGISDMVTESLMKIIQLRYGYNYQILNYPDDLNEYDDSTFSITGIQIADADVERFFDICERRKINGEDFVRAGFIHR